MRPVVLFFDAGTGLNLIGADAMHKSELDNIRQRDVPDIRSASHRKLIASGTITLPLRMGESRIRVKFLVVDRLPVPILLRTPS